MECYKATTNWIILVRNVYHQCVAVGETLFNLYLTPLLLSSGIVSHSFQNLKKKNYFRKANSHLALNKKYPPDL